MSGGEVEHASVDEHSSPPPVFHLGDDVAARLASLRALPATSAILVDFDGTLAPIVDDPASVRPFPGVAEALGRLASSYGLVAVLSGRPVSFLDTQLGDIAGVELVGLYGLEQMVDGQVLSLPGAEIWRPIVASVAERLVAMVPDGVAIERKGLTVTAHWRTAPDKGVEVEATVRKEAEESRLTAHPGRMSIELRPPLPVDKGSAAAGLLQSYRAACFFGDDLGDLPAFAALDHWSVAEDTVSVTVAVVDAESPAQVADAADVTVNGPAGALELLRWLADRTDDRQS